MFNVHCSNASCTCGPIKAEVKVRGIPGIPVLANIHWRIQGAIRSFMALFTVLEGPDLPKVAQKV